MHFTAPKNWMNDPNGLIQWGSEFHLFYQHNPHAPEWARPYWGHAVSDDLHSWRDLPIALEPDSEFDRAGCYSGCCVDDDGIPTIIYTGVVAEEGREGLVERVLSATSTDGLVTWVKSPTPLIAGPPDEIDAVGFRDPFVWRDADGTWHLILGCGSRTRGGMVLHYVSRDLRSWEYRGVLLEQSDIADTALVAATVWECPQLVRLGGRDIVIVSVLTSAPSHVVMIEGELRGDRFIPSAADRMDGGSSFYAPHVTRLADGRWAALGWLQESTSRDPSDWAGTLSLPRELLMSDGVVVQRPLHEFARLRGTRTDALMPVAPGQPATPLISHAAPFEVRIRGPVQARHQLSIGTPQGVVVLPGLDGPGAPHDDRPLDVTIVVDRFITEVFSEGRPVMTTRADGRSTAGHPLELGTTGDGFAVLVSWWPLTPA
nr:glycoside hydrolase family 32 protein [Galbitalea soli]